MKITIEQYDHKITYEVPYNDVNMEQMLEILENLLKCTGYCFSGNLEIVDDSVEDGEENWVDNTLMKEMNDKQNERIMKLINPNQ
jgi:uncharacterized protein YajQ (UPF0234 family)